MVNEVVSAAISNKTKNTIAKKPPKTICEKAMGRLLKTSEGPESGANPTLKSDGKIIKPARIATSVLMIPVMQAVLTSFSSFLR